MIPFSAFFSKYTAILLMVGIAALVFTLIAFDSSGMPGQQKDESSPHVLCTAGTTIIKRPEKSVVLSAEKSTDIRRGDQIRTRAQSSATVFWADGSITRLSENTSIDVSELVADKKTSSLKVDFTLEEGKTWSHIYRYLSDDSSFKERFDGGSKVAAVRGTAFEVNAEKNYLKTASHSVDITDVSGKLLSTVPEGVAVDIKSLKTFIDSSLDAGWEQLNLTEDAKFSLEMAKKAKAEVSSRIAALKGLPVSVSFSGNTLSVDVPPDFSSKIKKGQDGYAELLKIYEITAALPEDVETIRSKESLRDAILAAAPESEKQKLATVFARHETYDSWSASSLGNDEFLRARTKLREYLSAGADSESVKRMESALPQAKVDQFNAKMDELKKRGFDKLSDPNLFVNPSKAVLDAADGMRSTIQDAKNLVPSLVR